MYLKSTQYQRNMIYTIICDIVHVVIIKTSHIPASVPRGVALIILVVYQAYCYGIHMFDTNHDTQLELEHLYSTMVPASNSEVKRSIIVRFYACSVSRNLLITHIR